MLSDITIGQMFPGNSLIHKLDARYKIVFTIIFMVMLFCANSLIGMAITLLFVIFIYLLAKIPLTMLLKSLKPIIPIVIFMTVFNVFFYSGETVIFKWGIIKLTLEGLKMTGVMMFRVISVISGTAMLTYTTSSIELTDAIESLMSPLKKVKFPVHDLSMMMTIALRFIPTLIEETDKIMSAQKSRGADFESGNIIKRAKALMPILIPLFLSAVTRAGELATAMESRCYRGGEGRTKMKQPKSDKRDYISLVFMIVLTALVISLNYIKF
ncbi:MAG: energy-coupling factor transporter transmembrane protein EcfT [Oscillospiraceae bacterium]|nr:energy-coupling factor transporter transmembrane protein EcfT [Oscillospiraceae bacterium]